MEKCNELRNQISIDRKGVETYFAAIGILGNEVHKILSEQKKIRAVIDYDPAKNKINIKVFDLAN